MHSRVCATATAAFFSLPLPNRRASRRNRAPERRAGRGAPGRPGSFDHGGAQVLVAFAGGGLLALAGRLVTAGRQPGPGGQPGGGGEPGHVAAGLGDDHLCGPLPDAGDGDQPGDQPHERRGRLGDQNVQLGDLGGEVVIGIQVQPAHLAVGSGEPAVAGHLQVLGLAAQHAFGQAGQLAGVPLARDQRLDHRPARDAQQPARHRIDLDASRWFAPAEGAAPVAAPRKGARGKDDDHWRAVYTAWLQAMESAPRAPVKWMLASGRWPAGDATMRRWIARARQRAAELGWDQGESPQKGTGFLRQRDERPASESGQDDHGSG